MSSLIQEINHFPKESVYDNFFRICLPDAKVKYEKITRKKMIEQIIEKYSPQYIIDICTVKELKLLKRIVENNYKEVDVHRMPFEKVALYRKYLLFEDEIPDELKESVVAALKLIDFEKKEKQDEPLLCVIGYIRSCAICHPFLVDAYAQSYGLDMENVRTNPLFYFWVYYTTGCPYPNDTYGEAFVYQDSYDDMDIIAEERLKYEMVTPVYLEPESYLSIFYNGYDDTDPDIHALFVHLKENNDVFNQLKMDRILRYIKSGNMCEGLIEFYVKSACFDLETTDLFKKAMHKMPLPNLFGMTLNDYQQAMDKEKALNEIRSKNIKQMNARIDQNDVKLFYRLYLSLLDFMNSIENVEPNFKISQDQYINPDRLIIVIDAFWQDPDKWINMYIKENPLNLTSRNLNIVQNFKHGKRKDFMIVAFKKRHTIFNDGEYNYMVKGLNSNIDEIIHVEQLPVYVRTTLLPFKDDIIYDSILGSSQIELGINISLKVFEEYVSQPKLYTLPNEKGNQNHLGF